MNATDFMQLDDSQVKFLSPSPPLCSRVRESEQEKTFSLQLRLGADCFTVVIFPFSPFIVPHSNFFAHL